MMWARKAVGQALAASAVIGVAAGACLPASAWADTIVVRASGPSAKTYAPGSKLAAGGSISLKAGDVVTLLDSKGTRVLRGPGQFPVETATRPAPASGVMLSALLDTKRVRRARTGAVRGTISDAPVAAARRPNLWLADIGKPGTFCVADPAALRLWRGDASKPLELQVSGGGAVGKTVFAAGESLAAWPSGVPVRNGSAYVLSDGAQATEIRLAFMTTVTPGLDETAAALIANQCTAQLDLLVDTATLADSKPRE